MASSSSTTEIVELKNESESLRSFSRVNRLGVKLGATEGKSHSYPVGEELDRLIDAIDLKATPRALRHSLEKQVRVAVPRASGTGGSESPSLKQALRRLCISQASEMAAIRRSSKLIGSSSISDSGTIEKLYASVLVEARGCGNLLDKNSQTAQVGEACNVKSSWKSSVSSPRCALSALRTARIRRAQDSVSTESEINGTENSKANACFGKKGKQESIQAHGDPSVVNTSSDVGAPPSQSRLTSSKFISPTSIKKSPDNTTGVSSSSRIDDVNCGTKVNRVLILREKGECSQSSLSSSGEFSSSTSISEESSGSGINCYRPHMSKDVRWEAIHHVIREEGRLGLKNFKLLRRLGCGDIGTVYLAELLGTGCLFALKVMDVEFLIRRRKMLRAQTERDILQMLDHPFLPTLYTNFTTDNLSFLVMEYCSGGDLHVLRQMQPGRNFNETAARFYVAEVLLALEYLHMLGVIYRDLKPENILVRDDGHIMLSDFDLSMRCTVSPARLSSFSLAAKELQRTVSGSCSEASCIDPFCLQPSWVQTSCFGPRLPPASAALKTRKVKPDINHVRPLPQLVVEPINARSNSFVGTHEYLAPEIIRGDGHGSSVDWWTLGIFLYELLFGRTPFKGLGNEDTLANVVSESLKFPESPEVGSYAKDLIKGLLTKEPGSRLGSVRGAAEIKQHPFFKGLNWALIRCATPPEVPGFYSAEIPKEERKYQDLDQVF